MSLILNIDTALQQATVTIAENGNILAEKFNDVQKNHAIFLHIAINEMLKNLNYLPTQLNAIATTIGPGSYTGIRVGLASAKGLSFALQKPLITINNLELMANNIAKNNVLKNNVLLCPMIDARRLEVFTALYNNDCKVLMQPHSLVLTNNSFSKELEQNNIYFFGDGMPKFKNICNHKNALFIEISTLVDTLNSLSSKMFLQKIFTNNSSSIPLYAKEFYNI